MEFEEELSNFLIFFEPYSLSYFENRRIRLGKYPVLIEKFYGNLADISAGGKRMRGFLIYLGYLIGGGKDIERILPICLATEIIHTFLLIHDDIIDKADTRRGKETIHKRYEKYFDYHYGISQAIILGDIACFEALELINSSTFGDELKISCQKKVFEVLLETAYGEALDIENAYGVPKMKDILQVTDLKTSRYSFVAPLVVGATFGGKISQQQLREIDKFGRLVGIAFQLQDDLLGLYGDEKILGKSVVSDMREGKNTLVIHKAREFASSRDKKILNSIWGKNDARKSDLKLVQNIVKRSGAYNWCMDEMRRLSKKAIGYIDLISNSKDIQKILRQMTEFIVSRRS